MEQMEFADHADAYGDTSIHAHVSWADGFHARGHVKRHANWVCQELVDLPSSHVNCRCRQLAMYAIYEKARCQMLADSPTNYLRQKRSAYWKFLSAVPLRASGRKRRGLDGRIWRIRSLSARRSGKDWYCGAMTDLNST